MFRAIENIQLVWVPLPVWKRCKPGIPPLAHSGQLSGIMELQKDTLVLSFPSWDALAHPALSASALEPRRQRPALALVFACSLADSTVPNYLMGFAGVTVMKR